MGTNWRWGVAVAVCSWLLAAAALAAANPEKIETAREILRLYLDGEYQAFVDRGDATVKAGFTAKQAAATKQQLEALYGPFQSIDGVEHKFVQGMDAVMFNARHERAILTLLVALNDQDEMAGFRVVNIEQLKEWEPPKYADQSKFTESDLTVKEGRYELPGKLCTPKGAGPFPAIVLVHGSGPHDADETILVNKPFKDLAWGLASQGVAVLRYEKRTHKYGAEMDVEKLTLEEEVIDDALAAVNLLREQPKIDAKHVFVLGHSLGGLAAPYIGARDDKLGGLVILAGSARPLLDVVCEQIAYLSNLDGDMTDDEQAVLDQAKEVRRQVRAGKLEDPSPPLLGAPAAYWAHIDARRPAEEAATLDMPMMVIQAGRDYQVTDDCFTVWKQQLNGRDRVWFAHYDNLNHLMMAGEGKATNEEYAVAGHVDEKVVKDIAAWIRGS